MRTSSLHLQSGFRSTTHLVMAEDLESPRHSRYFAGKRPRWACFTK